MIINVEVGSFEELQDLCWSGARRDRDRSGNKKD